MFSMLIRRIKYRISGGVMRLLTGLFSTAIIVTIVIIAMSGGFNQVGAVKTAANFFSDSGKKTSEIISNAMSGDTAYVSVTDKGVYFKGCEPKGAKIIKSDSIKVDKNQEAIKYDPDTGLIEDYENFSSSDSKGDEK